MAQTSASSHLSACAHGTVCTHFGYFCSLVMLCSRLHYVGVGFGPISSLLMQRNWILFVVIWFASLYSYRVTVKVNLGTEVNLMFCDSMVEIWNLNTFKEEKHMPYIFLSDEAITSYMAAGFIVTDMMDL
jgi:hypothetical protein